MIDAFSRKVIGRSTAAHIRENLVIDAPGQAAGRERPSGHGPVSHDDRGARHTSRAPQGVLERHGITQSVSRPGNPYDNAPAESFLKTPGIELVKGRAYEDQEEARQEIFKYVRLYYNTKRMHLSLGHVSPCDFERQTA